MQLENGTYPARPTGHVEVGDHANGCLIATVEFAFEDGQKISNTFWLTTKDGTVNTKAIDTLKKVFGWDGADPFWLMDNGEALAEIDVELIIENETYVGSKDGLEHTAPKIKWVNLPGGSAGGNEVANGDRKTVLAKYGAKLRAVSGGAPAKKTSKPPSTPPTKAPPAKKKKAILPSDMNACWKALNDAMSAQTREEIEAKWFEIIKEVHGDKEQTAYDASDWGAIMAHLKTAFDNLPF